MTSGKRQTATKPQKELIEVVASYIEKPIEVHELNQQEAPAIAGMAIEKKITLPFSSADH